MATTDAGAGWPVLWALITGVVIATALSSQPPHRMCALHSLGAGAGRRLSARRYCSAGSRMETAVSTFTPSFR